MKQKVAGEGFEVEKLVYIGKTLDDGQTLVDVKYEPAKFIVIILVGLLLSSPVDCHSLSWLLLEEAPRRSEAPG
jgi:hypothetical protein